MFCSGSHNTEMVWLVLVLRDSCSCTTLFASLHIVSSPTPREISRKHFYFVYFFMASLPFLSPTLHIFLFYVSLPSRLQYKPLLFLLCLDIPSQLTTSSFLSVFLPRPLSPPSISPSLHVTTLPSHCLSPQSASIPLSYHPSRRPQSLFPINTLHYLYLNLPLSAASFSVTILAFTQPSPLVPPFLHLTDFPGEAGGHRCRECVLCVVCVRLWNGFLCNEAPVDDSLSGLSGSHTC